MSQTSLYFNLMVIHQNLTDNLGIYISTINIILQVAHPCTLIGIGKSYLP